MEVNELSKALREQCKDCSEIGINDKGCSPMFYCPILDAADALEKLQCQLAKVALSALRTQEEAEKNEPLTLAELRQMDGEKIYIRYVNHCKIFYNDEIAPYYGKDEQYIQRDNGMLRACDLPLKYYGEEWLAYRRKPREDAENA